MPPSVELQITPKIVLKKFNVMDPNNSQAELVRDPEDDARDRTFKDVTYKEWLCVFALCFVNLINYMDRYTIAGVLTDIQTYYDINNDKGGLLQTAFVVTYMLFGPLFGFLGDRYNRKLLMAVGVFLWSATTLTGSFMENYWLFLLFRSLVGIGEASYSTIAPTIIGDMFVGDLRSKMLALFYFAIPVGSGLGYIVGSETANALGQWQYALRVTPALGVLAVIFIVFLMTDPERGASEGGGHLESTSWREDLKEIVRNRSFMLSTAGFTCVAFVTGALAWWAPKYITMGVEIQHGSLKTDAISFKFGVIAMISGLIGVPAGSFLAQKLRHKYKRIDAYVCGGGLLVSSPLVFGALVMARYNTDICFVLVFFGELFLNLTWSIVADILLYVVMPNRRSTAEGVQLLMSHSLGDAGSPYLIGVLSEAFLLMLKPSTVSTVTEAYNTTTTIASTSTTIAAATATLEEFKSLQYALFATCFVEILGGLFFLVNAFYIVEDREKVERAIQEAVEHQRHNSEQPGTLQGNSQHLLINDEQQTF